MEEYLQLKEAGLKITNPRLKVLNILARSTTTHQSAEEIYKSLQALREDVSLATVYRVLTQFEIAGLVVKHNFEADHFVYELSRGGHHDHLICEQCNKIVEFVDPIIESKQKKIAAQENFYMTGHTLNIYGICASCKKQD